MPNSLMVTLKQNDISSWIYSQLPVPLNDCVHVKRSKYNSPPHTDDLSIHKANGAVLQRSDSFCAH